MLLPMQGKSRVLALMPPKAVGENYLNDFKTKFGLDVSPDPLARRSLLTIRLQVLPVTNRAEAIPALKSAMADCGPYQAFMILMGTAPFEPFDYFEPLLPQCKIIVSASAGYNEFPVDWMTQNGGLVLQYKKRCGGARCGYGNVLNACGGEGYLKG